VYRLSVRDVFINSNQKNYFKRWGGGDSPFIKPSIFSNKLFLASHNRRTGQFVLINPINQPYKYNSV
jgi:hypothetical protein